MIELNACNIKKAIADKALDMVNKNRAGFVYTNETVCIFNSMFIFEALFNNKCAMLDNALERLYYIAQELFQCKKKDDDDYYNVTVVTNPDNAVVKINGIETKKRSLAAGSEVTIVASLQGYYDKTVVIESLNEDKTITITFTENDKKAKYFDVTVFPTPDDAIVTIDGTRTTRAKVVEGKTCTVIVSKTGYQTYTNTFVVNDDKQLFVNLQPIRCRVDVITIPSDANCTINGVNTKSTTVDYDTELTIVVSKTGYVTKTQTFVIKENRSITISLDEEIPPEPEYFDLTINVVDNDTSEGIAGATVKIQKISPLSLMIPADEIGDGVYEVTEIEKGNYAVYAEKAGYSSQAKGATFDSNYHTITIELTAESVPVNDITLTISVVDDDTSDPITGADVTLVNLDTNTNYNTVVSGNNYVATVPPGTYTINCSKSGYIGNSVTNEYNTNTSVEVRLTAEVTPPAMANITVIVTDADMNNAPVSDATVKLLVHGQENNRCTEDPTTPGTYRISLPAGRYYIRFEKQGYETITTFSQDFVDGTVYNLSVHHIFFDLPVTVVDNDTENIITGATVRAINHMFNVEYNLTQDAQTGNYVATHIMAGYYSIQASATGYISRETERSYYNDTPRDPVYIRLTKEVPTNVDLTVDLDDINGNPILGATVKLIGSNNTEYIAVDSNNTGLYKVVGIPVGTYSVSAEKTGYNSGTVAATYYGNNTTIPMVLTAAAPNNITMTVHVVDSYSLEPISGATVTLNDGSNVYNANYDTLGNYVVSVPIGSYSINVSKSGYISNGVASAAYNRDTTVTVQLEHTGIRVEVDDANRPGAIVTMNGVAQKIGYYSKNDTVVIVATLNGYNKEIWHVRVNQNVVIPLQMSQATTNPVPGNVTLRMQAMKQPTIMPIMNTNFLVDNTDTVASGQEYSTSSSTHNISVTKSGYKFDEFSYGYTGDTDIYFVLAPES